MAARRARLLTHVDETTTALGRNEGRRLTRDKKRHPRLRSIVLTRRSDRFPVLLVKQYFEGASAQIPALRILPTPYATRCPYNTRASAPTRFPRPTPPTFVSLQHMSKQNLARFYSLSFCALQKV
jgi:hypothetical protein